MKSDPAAVSNLSEIGEKPPTNISENVETNPEAYAG